MIFSFFTILKYHTAAEPVPNQQVIDKAEELLLNDIELFAWMHLQLEVLDGRFHPTLLMTGECVKHLRRLVGCDAVLGEYIFDENVEVKRFWSPVYGLHIFGRRYHIHRFSRDGDCPGTVPEMFPRTAIKIWDIEVCG